MTEEVAEGIERKLENTKILCPTTKYIEEETLVAQLLFQLIVTPPTYRNT